MAQERKQLPYCHKVDKRGEFLGVTNSRTWKEINLIKTNPNEIRGNHYHKHTFEYIFLQKGKAEVELMDVNSPREKSRFLLSENEGVLVRPNTLHTFLYLEESEQISLLDCVFDMATPDLHLLSNEKENCNADR